MTPLSPSKPLPDIGEIQTSNIKNDDVDSDQEEMVGSLMGSLVVFLVCIDKKQRNCYIDKKKAVLILLC